MKLDKNESYFDKYEYFVINDRGKENFKPAEKSNKHFGPVMFQQTRGNIINDKILYIPNPWIVLDYNKFNRNNLKKFKNIERNYINYL